jgi:hypothetical protein
VSSSHLLEALGVGSSRNDSRSTAPFWRNPEFYHAVFPSPIPPNSPKSTCGFRGTPKSTPWPSIRMDSAEREVTVAMPDSGWLRHPFFTACIYQVETPIAVVPCTDRSKDPQGRGTGESANIFALHPEAILQPIRAATTAAIWLARSPDS